MLLSLVDVFLVCYFNRTITVFMADLIAKVWQVLLPLMIVFFMADVVANDLWLMLLPIFNG